jgi:hypothetical protein
MNRNDFTHRYLSGIEAGIHSHDINTSPSVAGHDCALDWCGAAPTRQQGGVYVQTAQPWRSEDRDGQYQTVRGHDYNISRETVEGFLDFDVAQGTWREDWNSKRIRRRVYRCPSYLKAPRATPRRRTRVGGDRHMSVPRHFQQRRNRKFRRTHEDNSHNRQQHPGLHHRSLTMPQPLWQLEKSHLFSALAFAVGHARM